NAAAAGVEIPADLLEAAITDPSPLAPTREIALQPASVAPHSARLPGGPKTRPVSFEAAEFLQRRGPPRHCRDTGARNFDETQLGHDLDELLDFTRAARNLEN